MDSLEPQLKELLEKYKSHFSLQENGKILCSINGHTLPPRFNEVSKFIQGPKFQKLLRRHQAEDALQKYEPFIVQSKNFPLMLYCALTGQLMDKSVEAVKKHMQGKKFQRAKDRFTNDEIDLKPEPSLESFGIKLPKNEDAAAAAGDGVEQHGKGSKQRRQHIKAAANGAAAAAAAADDDDEGSSDEPAFWVPSDEGATDSEQEGEESGSGDDEQHDDDIDMDAEAEPSGDPMEEDGAPQQQQTAAAASSKKQKAAAEAAVGGRGSKQRQKQKQLEQSKPAGTKKKQNITRPSAAKKAKR